MASKAKSIGQSIVRAQLFSPRELALYFAIESKCSSFKGAEGIIDTARVFESYLSGSLSAAAKAKPKRAKRRAA